MQHAVLDFLRSALIPELRADIAAGSSCNIHLVLVTVVALRALPEELSVLLNNADFAVVAANLTVVALCVQLSVHNVVVDELDNL